MNETVSMKQDRYKYLIKYKFMKLRERKKLENTLKLMKTDFDRTRIRRHLENCRSSIKKNNIRIRKLKRDLNPQLRN